MKKSKKQGDPDHRINQKRSPAEKVGAKKEL